MKLRNYPKTVVRKKVMKSIFWTAFSLLLFLSVVAIVRVGNAKSGAAEASVQPVPYESNTVNKGISEGAQSFAENFATEYFHWKNTEEEQKKRMERLKPFLAEGLDSQAGLIFQEMEWNSSLSKTQVWHVEEVNKDTALITLRILQDLNKITPPDSAAIKKAKKKHKPLPKAKIEKSGPYEKYFVIPVKTDGKSFVVYQIPYLIAPPKKPSISSHHDSQEEGIIQDSKLENEIVTGLNTFFKVYTTGTQEELSYYIKNNDIQIMKGVITFKEIKKVLIKPSKAKNEYLVYANVVFQENHSKAQVVYPYELTLVKEESRWFVKEMKNQ